jgi:hypothetical protein
MGKRGVVEIFEVRYFWPGHDRQCADVVSARSRSGARYAVWLNVADVVSDWKFGDFLRETDPRATRSPRRPPAYDYVAEHYGVRVSAGDAVKLPDKGTGIVAAPRHSRECYVYAFVDGIERGGALPFHPSEVSRIGESSGETA